MSEPSEREDWEALLTTPGFLRLVEQARKEWAGDGLARKYKRAVTDAVDNKVDAAQAVLRVDAANDAVNALLSFPAERVKQLREIEAQRKQERQEPLSRRGTL